MMNEEKRPELAKIASCNPPEKRKRRKKANPAEWKRAKEAKFRERGVEYLGCQYEKVITATGEEKKRFLQNKIVPGRKLGERCQGHNADGVQSGFKCHTITEEERAEMFRTFWHNLNWPQRKVLIPNLVKTAEVKRRRTDSWNERVNFSHRYYLKPKLEEVRVCLKMFSSTFDLSSSTIQRWVSNDPFSGKTVKTEPGASTSKRKSQASREQERERERDPLAQFFNSLPKLPTHYNQSSSTNTSTTSQCLEPSISSKNQLFSVYKQTLTSAKGKPVSRVTFEDEFANQNLSIYNPPQKGQCSACFEFEAGNLQHELYQQHIHSKDRAQMEKRKDKLWAEKKQVHLITADVLPVQQSPVVYEPEMFLKSRLNLHNYSVYDVDTENASCYWWTEVECDLSPSAFINCLLHHCQTAFRDQIPIVIFSDGGLHNRNPMMSNALLNYAVLCKKSIVQKFLVEGHTEMEVDSVLSAIESKKVGREIHLPSEYIKISKEARPSPRPYSSMLLTRDFFKDYSPLGQHFYEPIRSGNDNDNVFGDICALKYDPEGIIYFKTDFDHPWQEMPGKLPEKVALDFSTFTPLHEHPRPLSHQKFYDLQSLKSFIPHDCHCYYDSLPHE